MYGCGLFCELLLTTAVNGQRQNQAEKEAAWGIESSIISPSVFDTKIIKKKKKRKGTAMQFSRMSRCYVAGAVLVKRN